MHSLQEEILRHEEEQRMMASSSGRYTSSEHASSSDEHLHRAQQRAADASDLEHHQEAVLRDLHDQYEEELDALHSDEEHYRAHYSRLQDEMRIMAEHAERVKEEALHEAIEADERALNAEQKVKEAE